MEQNENKTTELTNEIKSADNSTETIVNKDNDTLQEATPITSETNSDFSIPINKEALEEENKLFNTLKDELKELQELVSSSDDFRAVRKRIVELKEKVVALYLVSKTEKDDFIDSLQKSFEVLSERQEKVKEDLEAKWNENLESISGEIEETFEKIKDMTLFKEARELLINVQKKVKDIDLKKDAKDSIFKRLQDAFTDINERQDRERESYEMECSENYLNIKPKVEAAVKASEVAENFKNARQFLMDTQTSLKDLKLKKEQRDELFGAIRAAFDALNQRQDIERKEFDEIANASYAQIRPIIDEAIAFAANIADFAKARQTLIDAQSKLKDLKLKRTQRDELYAAIREVFNKLNESENSDKEEFFAEAEANYLKLEVKANEAIALVNYSTDFAEIRDALIAVQDEVKIVKLTKNQRNDLFSRLRTAFKEFDAKRDDFMSKRRTEKKARLEKVLGDVKRKYDRAKANNEEDQIEALEARIKDIEQEMAKLSKR